MKNRIQSLSFIATLAVVFGMISWGSALAQTTSSTPDQTTLQQTQPAPTPDTPPSQQTPQTQPTPTPDTPPATQQTPTSQTPSQTPDQSQAPNTGNSPSNTAPSAGASDNGAAATSADSQSFSGTVVKQGDKYMLKDDSGKTYDIDHQTDVAKFEGKRVRVKGSLDSTGTKIMVK